MFKKTASLLALSVQLGAYCYPEYCFTSSKNEDYCFDMIEHTLQKTSDFGTFNEPLVLDSKKDNTYKYHVPNGTLKIAFTKYKKGSMTLDIVHDKNNSERIDFGVLQDIVEHTYSYKMSGPKEVRMGWMTVDEWNANEKRKRCKSYFWCP